MLFYVLVASQSIQTQCFILMTVNYDITLDGVNQIIEVMVEGCFTEQSFIKHIKEMSAVVSQLKDPNNVLILIDAHKIGKAGHRVRKHGNKLFENGLKKVALWGCNPVIRTLVSFFSIAFGSGKMRAFLTKDEARQWLLS